MRWETLREDTAENALIDLATLSVPPARGSGRAGLAAPGSGPIMAGDDGDAIAVEIKARSIINRVPGSSPVPFRWTINPYRGCSHACVYCLAGDTPILMADGRTRPLAEVKVGDQIYGTRRVGAYRRYEPTTVLAHWSTVKPAHRVTLADGTELVASGDHRFLSDRGWKFVTGTRQGTGRRPHLTTGVKLMGTGRFADHPAHTEEYRIGYLCGMIRGDAHLARFEYRRPGRACGAVYRFRLALADHEALERSTAFLSSLDIRADRFEFAAQTPRRRAMSAIRTSRRDDFERITELITWPTLPTEGWSAGFLAGMFDAEGSCSGGILRISNPDPEIIESIVLALKRLRFRFVVEERAGANGLRVVRLVGGLSERLRFFHAVDPAITRKRDIAGVAIKSAAQLGVVSVEPTGLDLPLYDITTGTGDFIANGVVSHNCFARRTHEYLDLDSGRDFDTKIMVKVNAPELVRAELARPSWAGESIAMGTNTDPYQRAEGRYRLMPGIIGALRDFGNPFSILTKGRLILRDAELIAAAAEETDVSLAVSVGFVDEVLWRSVEPGTPRPSARLDVVRRFADLGLGCSVLMAPILPGLTDSEEQIDRTVAAIAAAGALRVTPLILHLRTGAKEWYAAWLAREHPDLVGRYRELYGNGAYAPKPYRELVAARVRQAARRHGLGRREERTEPRSRWEGGSGSARPTPPEPSGEQLALM